MNKKPSGKGKTSCFSRVKEGGVKKTLKGKEGQCGKEQVVGLGRRMCIEYWTNLMLGLGG